jgi:hypothetical protein
MEGMIILEQYPLPEQGIVKLNIQHSFEITVTAQEAQHKVDDWLFDEVSYMMTAGTPMLVVGDTIVWRVPAILTASHIGHVGVIGNVEVQVETGRINNSQRLQEQLLQAAKLLVVNLLPANLHSSPEALAPFEHYLNLSAQPVKNELEFSPALR